MMIRINARIALIALILFVSACDDADPMQCVMKHCTLQTMMCMLDENCSNWIQCVEGCEEDDKINCPTFCVMYYSSPVIDAFIGCAMDDFGCYIEDYSAYPDCTAPDGERLDLAGMHGSWWLTRVHNNETSMFEFQCQNFSFEEHSSERLSLDFTVPLEHDGEWRIPVTETDFQWRSDGSILVDYPAWSNYTEDWHLLHKTENTLVAHVCFESYEDYKNYGKLVLSRMPIEDLESEEREALDKALQEAYNLGLQDFDTVGTNDCSNADQ